MKDYKLYNSKDSTRIMVDFFKDRAFLTGEILSHKDGVYIIKSITGKEFSLKDDEIENLDPIEDSENDLYEIYLSIDMSKTIAYWRKTLGVDPADKDLTTDKASFDIQEITDKLFEYAQEGLKKFYTNGDIDIPYYPLAYIVVMDLLNKMFGGFWATMIGSSPMTEMMVLCWLHGYLTSSAIRKQGVKSKVRTEQVSPQEIAEKQAEQEEMVQRIIEHIKQHIDEQGEDNDRGTEGTES